MENRPCVVAVSGVKNSGKTRLIVSLLPELIRRGLRVATIKHDGHRFEADRPDTDSFRHLEAGALGTAVFDGEKYQLVRRAEVDERFLITQFPEADLVLLEGFKDSNWPKIEIVRAAVSGQPVCHPSARLALVTDCTIKTPGCPVFALDDLTGLADFLLRFVRCGRRFSAVLLSGGYSSRMGRDKAELPFDGLRMIDWQTRRLQMLGITDILVAGYEGTVESGRCVPDIVPHRGPLSGIHAGLSAAACGACIVLSVDAPLVPLSALFALMEQHRGGVTVLSHGGQLEPLIGVYDRSLAQLCSELLQGELFSVRRLLDTVGFESLPWEDSEDILANCNTPEEYMRLLSLVRADKEAGCPQNRQKAVFNRSLSGE